MNLGVIQFVVYPNDDPYYIDLIAMQQYNIRLGYRRENLVVELDDKLSSKELIASSCEGSKVC